MVTAEKKPIALSYRHDMPSMTGARRANGQLVAAYEDSDFVLRSILDSLGLTPITLARLVGRSSSNSYKWFSEPKGPSQAYWVRIAHLQNLVLTGYNLKRIRTIDWSKPPYRIEWWPGAEPTEEGEDGSQQQTKSGNAVRKSWGDIPKAQS